MATKFDLCSAALTQIGANPISSFDDDTAEAVVASQNYELAVTNLLTKAPWTFAKATADLNQLTAEPASPWEKAYQLPADLLALRTVRYLGDKIDYQKMGDQIWCYVDGTVTAEYTWRKPESDWPPYFQSLVIEHMKAVFALGVAMKVGLAQEIEQKVITVTYPQAAAHDSQQSVTRRIRPGNIRRIR